MSWFFQRRFQVGSDDFASSDDRETLIARDQHGGALFKLLVLLTVIFAFGALAWMAFLPVLVTTQLRAKTGFDASVEQLAVNPLTGRVTLRGLVVTNPPTFPETPFLELREFRANAQVFSLFSDHPVFDSMVVDVANITLVKRSDGATNADAFQRNLQAPGDGKPRPPSVSPPKQILVRQLHLRIDRLVIADHTGRKPQVREYDLGINQDYTDVTDLNQLIAPKVLQTLAPIAAAVSGLLPGDVGKVLGEAAKSGADAVKEAGRETTVKAKRFFDALEESKKP